ncbi:hypothetical protein E4U09_004906, partial [Claviceps aff. purpurea]
MVKSISALSTREVVASSGKNGLYELRKGRKGKARVGQFTSPHHRKPSPSCARTTRGRYRQYTRDDRVCNYDYTASMGLPCYHKIMSILESGDVLKTTDFDVH